MYQGSFSLLLPLLVLQVFAFTYKLHIYYPTVLKIRGSLSIRLSRFRFHTIIWVS